ncbi:MAG: hypothetical protein QF569_29730, partial [Candidatus Poribacteria bacterium]|nr:hypothetical protein [Candidatus Poribacteria bacterium]
KIFEAGDGAVWVIIEDPQKQKRFYSLNNGQWTAHLTGKGITTVYQSADNDLWAGGTNGLYSFATQSWQLNAKVNCVYQLADGTMLVGTDSGLWIQQISEASDLTSALSGMFVIGLFQDSNSVIWARLDQNILSYDGRSWTNHNRVQGGYTTGYKACIHEGLDGTLWFADWSLES